MLTDTLYVLSRYTNLDRELIAEVRDFLTVETVRKQIFANKVRGQARIRTGNIRTRPQSRKYNTGHSSSSKQEKVKRIRIRHQHHLKKYQTKDVQSQEQLQPIKKLRIQHKDRINIPSSSTTTKTLNAAAPNSTSLHDHDAEHTSTLCDNDDMTFHPALNLRGHLQGRRNFLISLDHDKPSTFDSTTAAATAHRKSISPPPSVYIKPSWSSSDEQQKRFDKVAFPGIAAELYFRMLVDQENKDLKRWLTGVEVLF